VNSSRLRFVLNGYTLYAPRPVPRPHRSGAASRVSSLASRGAGPGPARTRDGGRALCVSYTVRYQEPAPGRLGQTSPWSGMHTAKHQHNKRVYILHRVPGSNLKLPRRKSNRSQTRGRAARRDARPEPRIAAASDSEDVTAATDGGGEERRGVGRGGKGSGESGGHENAGGKGGGGLGGGVGGW